LAPAAQAQNSEDKAAARATAQAGLQAMDEKRWSDAVDLLSRAESLMHAPTILLNLARSYAQLGKLVQAQEAYNQVAHETLAANASQPFVRAQADAQSELAALQPRVPMLTIKIASSPSLAVTMDGEQVRSAILGLPMPVNPGDHTLRATADGMAPGETKVSLKEGERQSASLTLVPLPPSAAGATPASAATPAAPEGSPAPKAGLSTMQIAGIGAGAVGVVGLALGGVFGAMAFSAKSQQQSDCAGPGNCTNRAGALSEHDSVNSDATLSTVAFVAGGVLVAGGVTLFFMGRSTEEKKPVALTVVPGFGPGAAFASLRGEF
jgi:hypothetical protein